MRDAPHRGLHQPYEQHDPHHPPNRRPSRSQSRGIPDGLLIALIVFLLGLTLLVWLATGLAAVFSHGAWPHGVTVSHTPVAMRELAASPKDLATAWPDTPAGRLSGYGLFWGLLIGEVLVLLVLTVFVLGTFTRWRAVRAARRTAAKGTGADRPYGTDRSYGTSGPYGARYGETQAGPDGTGPEPEPTVTPRVAPPRSPEQRATEPYEPREPYPPQGTEQHPAPGLPAGTAPPEGSATPAAAIPAGTATPATAAPTATPAPSTPTPATSGAPATPATPINPGTPGAPSAPATPSTSAAPINPGTRVTPSTSATPTTPSTPATPSTPTTPGTPVTVIAPVPAETPLPAPLVRFGPVADRRAAAVQAVSDAAGPALVVTSSPAVWAETKDARAKLGPVLVYDPGHLCDTPARLHWSPTSGCDDADTAAARAVALLAPVRPAARIDSAMADTAETLLRSWLHAAAVDGRPFRQVHRWAQGAGPAQEAVRILRTHPRARSGSAGLLESALTAYPERRDMAQELTARALSALSSVHIREACTPNRTDSVTLESFIHEGGTLYVVGEAIEDPRTHPGAMPLLTALASSVVEHGRRLAARSTDGRLDPPMALVLDDIAAVAPLPQLPELLTTGQTHGLHPLALLRSREQARARWPHRELPEATPF
ncbi:type VI secretion protein [Streptomyces sp. NPDC059398]|uniref:type VI secretion protein n=1 Tax=Streptomyces sp. NPDC059398 TaxID=3346820 RepID=UPI0036A4A2D6